MDEPISTLKIIRFLPVLPLECERNPCLSNPIPYPVHLYSSISSFLVKQAVPDTISANIEIFTYLINNAMCTIFP